MGQILALVKKDVLLFFRNPLYAAITGLMVVIYIAMYFLMPSSVNEEFELAIFLPDADSSFIDELLSLESEVVIFDTEDEMIAAVDEGEYMAGIAFEPNALGDMLAGDNTNMKIYIQPGLSPELTQFISDEFSFGLNNLAYMARGDGLDIQENQFTLGPDVGEKVPLRDRMLAVLLVMVLVIEVMGLANLITEERVSGTATAVLSTPLSLGGFFTAKTIMGIGLAFIETVLLVAVVGKLFTAPLIMLVILFIGGMLATGMAFLIASVARDMMSVFGWSVVAIFILYIPAFTILFPPLAATWVSQIPTYPLINALNQVMNFDAGWSTVGAPLAIVTVWSVAILGLGMAILGRKLTA